MKKVGIMTFMKSIVAALLIVVVCGVFIANCCYINTTSSLPVGLYIKTDRELTTGSFIVFEPDRQKHSFISRYIKENIPLIKKVAFTPGQNYTLPAAVTVDRSGRKIVPYLPKQGVVPEDHFIVLGNTVNSLDSRYLGLISSSQIIDQVVPFLVW